MRPTPEVNQVLTAVRHSLATVDGPLVLAVSGGSDSMVLLHAMWRVAPARVAAVATFDHGSGAAARRAVELVRVECARLGLAVVAGGGRRVGTTEAEWRDARWAFLHQTASAHGALVATAHTRDDHIETVLMRVMRGSGARGLAGLHAESAVLRPFLSVERGTIRAVGAEWGVGFVDDPTNASTRYLRNRLRRDLLPALREVHPEIDQMLLDLSTRAAEVRRGFDEVAGAVTERLTDGGVAVATAELRGYSRESLAALWPAVAARAGIVLDRRGTERAASFTIRSRVGGRIQLSGGWELVRGRERLELRREGQAEAGGSEQVLDGVSPVQWGAWRFRIGSTWSDSAWTAALAPDSLTVVRPWCAGDRMVAAGSTRARRVKRFLSDARISGPERVRWPVVVSNGEIVWIPGVRRSEAATARPGGSAVLYECEFDDRS